MDNQLHTAPAPAVDTHILFQVLQAERKIAPVLPTPIQP